MRRVKVGILAAIAVGILGTSTAAWACDLSGNIVCRNDTTKGVSGVQVVVSTSLYGEYGDQWFVTSGSDGSFSTHVGYTGLWYDVNLIAGTENAYCDMDANPIILAPILVDDEVQCSTPPPPPPPPLCVPRTPSVQFPYCPSRPLGKPNAECDLFGLAVQDKDDTGGPTVIASQSAPVAIVKAAGCYTAFFDVQEGVTELSGAYSQNVSHVTYCACPPQ